MQDQGTKDVKASFTISCRASVIRGFGTPLIPTLIAEASAGNVEETTPPATGLVVILMNEYGVFTGSPSVID